VDQLIDFFVPTTEQDNSVWGLLRDHKAVLLQEAYKDLGAGLQGEKGWLAGLSVWWLQL